MATHAMIDLETLDTKPTSVILTIGAVKFDPYNINEEPGTATPNSALYVKPDIDEQCNISRTISEGTMSWWGDQSKAAQEEAFSENDRVPLDQALQDLRAWCSDVECVWAQGVLFDFGILEHLYISRNQNPPWKFYRIRDSRTLLALMPEDPRKGMQQDLHNALSDSYYQARAVQMACQHFGIVEDVPF